MLVMMSVLVMTFFMIPYSLWCHFGCDNILAMIMYQLWHHSSYNDVLVMITYRLWYCEYCISYNNMFVMIILVILVVITCWLYWHIKYATHYSWRHFCYDNIMLMIGCLFYWYVGYDIILVIAIIGGYDNTLVMTTY